MKCLLCFFIVLLTISCQSDKKQEVVNHDLNTFRDTLKINYQDHKILFDILATLPDSSFASWRWTADERVVFARSIERTSLYIDTVADYFNIKTINPDFIKIQVIDGLWTLSLYEISPNNYMIITNDMVGDGNELNSYKMLDGELKQIEWRQLFGNGIKSLLKNPEDIACGQLLSDNQMTFSYDFSNEKYVIISSPYLIKKEVENCLKGNKLMFEFKSEQETFVLIETTWINTVTE